jgi:hypothetical protein
MLDRQIDDFACRDRLGYMVLGLLGTAERVASLAAAPRADGTRAAPGALADFFLGIISVSRSLRGTLSCEDPAAPVAAAGAGSAASGNLALR